MTPCEYEERNSFAELLSPVICSFLPMWMQNWISNLFCLTSWKQEKRNSQRKRIKKKGKKNCSQVLSWLDCRLAATISFCYIFSDVKGVFVVISIGLYTLQVCLNCCAGRQSNLLEPNGILPPTTPLGGSILVPCYL